MYFFIENIKKHLLVLIQNKDVKYIVKKEKKKRRRKVDGIAVVANSIKR